MKALFPIIMIIISGVIFFSLTDPLFDEIGVLRAEIATKDEALANAKTLRVELDNLLTVYQEFKPTDLDRLDKFLPDNVDNVHLLIDINNIASKYGMAIKNISLKTEEDTRSAQARGGTLVSASPAVALSGAGSLQVGSVTLGFSVSGSYRAFQLFIQDLARSLRLVDLQSITFSSEDRDFYQYNVEMRTYWLK